MFGRTEADGAGAPNASEERKQEFAFREINLKGGGSDAIVLMYHDVVASRTRDTLWYDSTTEEVRKDVEKLQEWGATFVSLEDLYQSLVNDRPLPPRSVVITYDDNYQGFYDFAWPVYAEKKIPVTMFVHTNFIGSQQGRPKMSEETLKELLKSGHFTIGSHTMSHPEDLRKLTSEQKRKEIFESREILEKTFGVEVRDISWPVGNYDAESKKMAIEAGYRMGFTMNSQIAWASPGILEINRYNPTKLDEAMAAAEAQGNDPLGYTEAAWGTNVVSREIARHEGVPLALVRGGRPKTVLVAGRESVSDLIANFQGVAGINGGFFVISDIASTDNRMIGPSITSNVAMWMPDLDSARLSKLINRPFIIMSPDKLILAPFRPAYNNREAVEQMVGPITDAFVAGAWLVHKGVPRTKEQIMTAATADAMDFRRRAFLGVTSDGDLVMGACTGSYSSDRLAKAVAAAGCVEAVLLDSGFSTSLVYNNEILASGHSTRAKPSRPVPHAIIVDGVLAGLTSSDEARTPSTEGAN